MALYMDILEEWDDKISEEKSVDDKNLRPVEWIDTNLNELNKNDIKYTLEKSFIEITEFVEDIYERYLVMYWENKQINY